MPDSTQPLFDGKAAPQTVAPAQPAKEPDIPTPVSYREFGDVAGTRKAIFDNVLSSLQQKYPISNDRYTLKLTGAKYRAPRDYSPREQKKAIMRGQTLGWNVVGAWELLDNATG